MNRLSLILMWGWAFFLEVNMANEKPFKTTNQMLKILRNRNLIIKNGSEAKRFLERENYYCVINGYKDLFLDKDRSSSEDYYKDGSSIFEIFELFKMDRELRNILLPELIKFESFIKTSVAYYFHESYPDKNSYLAFENYTSDTKKTKDILLVISVLSSNISKQKKNAVTYYIEKYQHCPLWVLTNYLTFGNISKLYKVCESSVRLQIAKEVSRHYYNNYKTKIHISAEMLDECLGVAVMLRNVCAHDERLYNYKTRFKEGSLERSLNYDKLRNKNIFSIVVLLKLFLPKNEYKMFLKKLENFIHTYNTSFTTISIDDIINAIGYDQNWIDKNK
ncbi:MAG: Abi family protein [Peptostreptococcus sp.]|uniref:Abi family protein n=1 Tax=Peptostreptococcus sp. TaxID=1262 RepID=UPI002FC76B3D